MHALDRRLEPLILRMVLGVDKKTNNHDMLKTDRCAKP